MDWKILAIFIALVSFGINSASGIQKPTNNELLSYLKHFNTNRHHFKNPKGKRQARDFIRDTFRSFGLHTWTESFNSSDPEIKDKVTGVNIVALLPGKLSKTRDDRLILIGSHYDTIRTTSHGADDNGSGVVALLQTAKQLSSKSDSCQREYSVMFVAFDFEEWENITLPHCGCARLGCGSRAFVANFSQYYNLFPNMSVARYGELQGAIIMDTMMNYNSTPKSQHGVEMLKSFFPSEYNAIKDNEDRGDFLIAVGRSTNDNHLLNTFSYYYKTYKSQDRKATSKYRLQVFPLPFDGRPKDLNSQTYSLVSHFLRSDHVNFWNEITSDRAIFLSDTANMRSYMRTCYHKDCDDLSHVTDDFLGFLAKSCEAIVMTTDDLTKNHCKKYTQTTVGNSDLPIGGSMTIGVVLGIIFSGSFGAFCCFRRKQTNDELVTNGETPNWSSTNPAYIAKEEAERREHGSRMSESRDPGAKGHESRQSEAKGQNSIA